MARGQKSRLFPPRSTGAVAFAPRSTGDAAGDLPDPPARAERPPSSSDETANAPRASGDRVGVPLTASGAFDLENMRPATRARVLDAIRKTKVDTAADASSESFHKLAETAINAIGISSFAIARMAGYSEERAMIMLWTHSEIMAVRDPMARVLAKYHESLKYADELMLASAGLAIIGQKVQMLRAPAPAPGAHGKPNGSEQASTEHHA